MTGPTLPRHGRVSSMIPLKVDPAPMLRQQLEQRLQTLKAELASGDQVLQDLDTQFSQLETKRTRVRDTLLRITGAIQVLEAELAHYNATRPPL